MLALCRKTVGSEVLCPRPGTVENGLGGGDAAPANLKAVLSHGLFLARGLCSQNTQ